MQTASLSVASLLSGEMERDYPEAQSLELAAIEPTSGALTIWNKKGKGVEILPEDQLSLVGLLLRQFVRQDHLEEMLIAGMHAGDATSTATVKDLANVLIHMVPGDDLKSVIIKAERMERAGEFFVPEEYKKLLRIHGAELLMQVKNHPQGIFRMDLDTPLDLSAPVEEQARDYWRHAYVGDCNDALARGYGMTPEQVIGKRIWEMLPSRDPQNVAVTMLMIQNHFRAPSLEFTGISANGTVLSQKASAFGVTEEGKLTRVWGTISEERVLGHKIAAHLAPTTAAAMVVIDTENKVCGWDANAEALFGWKQQEVLGKVVPLVRDWTIFGPVVDKVRTMGIALTFTELAPWHREGHRVPASFTVNPIFGPDGKVRKLAFVGTPLPQLDPNVQGDVMELENVLREIDAPAHRLGAPIRLDKLRSAGVKAMLVALALIPLLDPLSDMLLPA